ncbi:PadR family transcriptional regulator [Nonomuraea sp. NPDC049421]|uniref:PadR family transcriptional regulator n=1 Tax=Nonomuraea sp. NPDC049421 TaxID=3155275 RepID=UPI003414F2C4
MSLRHAVLGLLAERSASGYDLMKLFDVSLANVWPATQSQLYSELGKLADTGLVDVSAEGPRGRKEYTITEAGLAELRHWLTDVQPTRVVRSDMLLRVFFLGRLSPEQARAYLHGQAQLARKQLEHIESIRAFVESGSDDLSVYGRLVLDYGRRLAESQREWAEWAENQIG